MVRLVLFDIDGTLVHTGGAGVKAFAKVFATEFGAHNGTERMKFGGRTDVSLVREFFNLHGIETSPANFTRFFESYAFWLEEILSHTKGRECVGVLGFLDQLQSLPNPPMLGLLTGNIRLGAEIKLRHFNLWDIFVVGAFADDHEDRNQIAVSAWQRGSRALGRDLRGDEIVVVGDTPHDINCGRAIEAKVLAVATGGSKLEELQTFRPDWAVPHLGVLSAREVCQGN